MKFAVFSTLLFVSAHFLFDDRQSASEFLSYFPR